MLVLVLTVHCLQLTGHFLSLFALFLALPIYIRAKLSNEQDCNSINGIGIYGFMRG